MSQFGGLLPLKPKFLKIYCKILTFETELKWEWWQIRLFFQLCTIPKEKPEIYSDTYVLHVSICFRG